jgi:hypothetical protein
MRTLLMVCTLFSSCVSLLKHRFLEFRHVLELFERAPSLMSKIELDEHIRDGERSLLEFKQQFDATFNKELNESNQEKQKIFDSLRPTIGLPGKRTDLEDLNSREKVRQEQLEKILTRMQADAIVKEMICSG